MGREFYMSIDAEKYIKETITYHVGLRMNDVEAHTANVR